MFSGVIKQKLTAALIFLAVAPALTSCSPSPDTAPPADSRPNIVLIVIDDMGFNDLGANGNSEVRTPNLDALAAEGVRFTRHYVDSTCSPTRAGILTGTEPINHGFTPVARGISPEVITLPETLQTAGYTTHHIGKWHVGHTTRLAWPRQQGFDTFFGFLSQFLLKGPQVKGEFSYRRPTYQNPWLQSQNESPQQYEGHLSKILTSRAVKFIDSRKASDPPWFLNFWTYAPHAPIQPLADFARRYSDTPEGRYRALIEQVDDTVGRIIESLQSNKLAENTLLIVASDNGGTNRQIDNNAPYFGSKGTFSEGGVRTPLIIRWPGRFPAGLVFEKTVTNFDYFPTIATAADAHLSKDLTGRDLAMVVENNIDLAEPLFWESNNSEVYAWGGLSRDGRWRMHQYFVGPPALNDLQSDASGASDMLESNASVAESLHHQYLSWRHKRRVVPVNYIRSNARGQAILTGSSLQRSPGFSGHTFAIGVTPDTTPEPGIAIGKVERQVVADQQNQWNLGLVGRKLVAEINGITLEAPPLPSGQCSAVVLTSHFMFSALNPHLNHASIQLFVNGELQDSKEIEDPEMPGDDLLQPTYIGQDAQGQSLFGGVLSRPIIYNERLVADSKSDAKVENGIARVTDKLCL
jgi:arylsulfatase A-like enzyme